MLFLCSMKAKNNMPKTVMILVYLILGINNISLGQTGNVALVREVGKMRGSKKGDATYEYYPGVQVNKRFMNQGISFGINYMILESTETRGGRSIINLYGININHHINGADRRSFNSQSAELYFYPYQDLPFAGLGVEFKHYEFEHFTLSPKLRLWPSAGIGNVYFQKNYNLGESESIYTPEYTFGIEIYTNIIPILTSF